MLGAPQDGKQAKAKRGLNDPEVRERFMNFTGGWVPDRRPSKGKFVVANVGGKFAFDEVSKLVDVLERDLYYDIEAKECDAVTLKTAGQVAEKLGGTFTTFIVIDENLPGLVVLPEKMCALVNVQELNAGNPDGKKLAMRLRKELMRSLVMMMGGGYSTNGRGVMRIARNVEDLDMITALTIDPMVKRNMDMLGEEFGFKPFRRSTYRKLLEEGAAPEPQNEYQKKIKEEFLSNKPTKPLQIKFDKNKKDGVVK
jgi:hypothetical protein